MDTHYLPQALLKRFYSTSLLELDKSNGQISISSHRRGGQQADLYPPHIERGILQRLDNDAPRIFRRVLYGREHNPLSLTSLEKWTLSEWLLFFVFRVPANLELCNEQSQLWRATPTLTLSVLDEEYERLIFPGIRANFPAKYQQLCAAMGEENLKVQLYRLFRYRIINRHFAGHVEGRQTFEQMHVSGRHEAFITDIDKLKWTWLHTNGEFIIGDNPLCRWHTKLHAAGQGLRTRNLEITMPITKRTTLWMHRNYRHAELIICNRRWTRELNRRQISTALQFVYGPSERSLSCGAAIATETHTVAPRRHHDSTG